MTVRRKTILSVKALVSSARRSLESEFPEVDVEGEIVGCTSAASGHLYFTLKDAAAQVRCVMFRTSTRFLRFQPADGMEIVAGGRLSVYEPRGEMQFLIEKMELAGAGALAAAFERLKQELAAKGWFASDRKKPAPECPRTVGIVTSLSGAALYDALRTLFLRQPGLKVIVSPTQVQGVEAPAMIARAILDLDALKRCDVILLVRGGGSPEDLWAFNDPVVIEAVVECATPVISGIGHEIDLTLSDLAADLRAATPTAAAQAAVPDYREQAAVLSRAARRLGQVMVRRLQEDAQRLDDSNESFVASVARMLKTNRGYFLVARQRLVRCDPIKRLRENRKVLERLKKELASGVKSRVGSEKEGMALLEKRLERAAGRLLEKKKMTLALQANRLTDLSPNSVLKRGYSILRDPKTRRIARKAADHPPGSKLEATLSEGRLDIEVIRSKPTG